MKSSTNYSATKNPTTIKSSTTDLATMVSSAMDFSKMDTANIHADN